MTAVPFQTVGDTGSLRCCSTAALSYSRAGQNHRFLFPVEIVYDLLKSSVFFRRESSE